MNFIFISPIGKKSDLLFDTFEETFKANGHCITSNAGEADIAFVDLYSGLGNYDPDVMWIVGISDIPIVYLDFTDYGGMSLEKFDSGYYENVAVDKKIVYLMRKMDKTKTYPSWVYPIECIQ